jgi:thioredoxin 1
MSVVYGGASLRHILLVHLLCQALSILELQSSSHLILYSTIINTLLSTPYLSLSNRCGPCQMIAPKFEAMSQEFTNVIFVKVDVDAQEKIAGMCGIRAMPTFQFYKGGNKVDELCGANEAGIRSKIQANA